MAKAQLQQFSLRWNRLEKKRLLVALFISLLFHVVGLGVYRWGVKQHWWQPVKILSALPKKITPQKPPVVKPPEEQVIFIDVSHEEKEPPKKAKYYSNKNSAAANPDASKDLNDPKIAGKQTVMPKTESGQRPTKLQFATPAPAALHGIAPTTAEAPREPGDLDLAQKNSEQKKTQPTSQRPRTLKEAQQNLTPGEAMQQDGGVRRQRVWSSLDVKQTPFGNYDKQIIEAVTDRWYSLIDKGHFAQDRTGKVVVHFKLKYDGTILEMSTTENTVGMTLGYLCREAISQASPFARWPDDMRRMIGETFREVSFTFYY